MNANPDTQSKLASAGSVPPAVSVVMPVFNGERFIPEAVGSIFAQTFQDFEFILVDDGSSDGTMRALEPYRQRIKYVRHERNQGIARSVNDGLVNATGRMIAFCDSDDAWLPGFLETQVTYLHQHPEVAMVHSDFMTIDAGGKVLESSVAKCRNRGLRPSGHVFSQLFMDSFICGNTVLIRKEVLDRMGGFDERLRMGDYDLWLRIARDYRIDYVDEVLTKYRQYDAQTHRNVPSATGALPPARSTALEALLKALRQHPEIYDELGRDQINKRLASVNLDAAFLWYRKGIFRNARTCLLGAISCRPWNWRQYVMLALSFLKPKHAWTLYSGTV